MKNIRMLSYRLMNPLLDFLYPPICISCNKLLSNSKQRVCEECWNAIPSVTKNLPFYQEIRSRLIAEGCINDLVSCFVFEKEGPFQHIAHAMKYKGYKSIGLELGKRIGNLIRDWNVETDIIIPVPLHGIKYRERGYNQADLIAQGIASVTGNPIIENAVRRIRNTKTQTTLNIEERRINMENAFETQYGASQKLEDKSCLLVDDVITTGATINACAKEILAAGAKVIVSASAALAK